MNRRNFMQAVVQKPLAVKVNVDAHVRSLREHGFTILPAVACP